MDSLKTYYETYLPSSSIVYINNMAAAHTQPTDDPANVNKCDVSKTPYLSNCNYDGAGKALEQIYGTLIARNDGTLSGQMLEFDQTEFIVGYSMATTGYVYVPKACADMQPCKVGFEIGCMRNLKKCFLFALELYFAIFADLMRSVARVLPWVCAEL